MALSEDGLKKKFFWICFNLKSISKNKNQNIRIDFLISNKKMNFKKLFHFSILVMKLKHEKWKVFKIRFVFKSKNELYFWYADSVHVLDQEFLNSNSNSKLILNSNSNLNLNSSLNSNSNSNSNLTSISRSNSNSDLHSSSKSN